MKSNPRLLGVLMGGQFQIERKVNGLNTFFSTTLFCLFLGFVLGNLFGTFLVGFRNVFHWDGFIIFSILGFIELVNYGIYHPRGERNFLSRSESLLAEGEERGEPSVSPFSRSRIREATPSVKRSNTFGEQKKGRRGWSTLVWKTFNFFKIGLLLGFFIDAFKVGS